VIRTAVLLAIVIVSAVCAQVTLKVGLNRLGAIEEITPARVAAALTSPLVLLGIAFYLVSGLSWILALSRVDLSVGYPVLTLSAIGVSWASAVVLGEAVGFWRAVGTVLTVVGVWVVVRS
jgi:multidrug transporter EmrE-like cation transporter